MQKRKEGTPSLSLTRRSLFALGAGAVASVMMPLEGQSAEREVSSEDKKLAEEYFKKYLAEKGKGLTSSQITVTLKSTTMFEKTMVVFNLHDNGKFFGQLALESPLSTTSYDMFAMSISTTLMLNGKLKK